ncbi:tetratricopeptide repeat protein [uncultured Aquimarina sp.]|uniref:tetratricopeptide repeat protein n=1 Tax=uncultured Aquimarina sp. TaxID=575652 RepID=UPI0026066CC4|nr:tetratricopeptide repeat protein [uncultured Aquimarina sp.]
MKEQKLLITLFLFGNLLFPKFTNAQEVYDPCSYKLDMTAAYLTVNQNADTEIIDEISNAAAECMKTQSIITDYINGILLLIKNPDKESQKKGFELIKSAAEHDYLYATSLLGDLYKNGTGVSLNFDEALFWYKKAVELGDEKAAFKIGYLYLKGLGSVQQDYFEAIKWFEQSKYPMAKHWLAICYREGYGVQKNTEKAIDILKKNKINNSKTLLTQFQEEIISEQTNSNQIDADSFVQVYTENQQTNNISSTNQHFYISDITNEYKGSLVVYDWSGKHIVQSVPIRLDLKYDAYDDTLDYKLIINEETIKGEGLVYDTSASFENFNIQIDRKYLDQSSNNKINLSIFSIDFKKKSIEELNIIVGTLEAHINNWNEPSAPIKIILHPFSDNPNLSDEALLALGSQSNSFIKLYPNPFVNDLLIQYELKENATVSVAIQGVSNNIHKNITTSSIQSIGKKLYTLDGRELPSGLYVVSVIVNGINHNKLIVKK